MTDKPEQPSAMDPRQFAESLATITARSQQIVNDFMARNADMTALRNPDPMGLGRAYTEMMTHLLQDPQKMLSAQTALWQDYLKLWQNATRRMLGEQPEPLVAPRKGDNRFRDPAWSENYVFDYIKQSYLLTAGWIQKTVHDVEGLDPHTAKKVDFCTRQYVDALAPTNFVMTNPQVLRTTIESGGENLLHGLENLLRDLERGKGQLRISQTDETAFEIGRNVAVTPGKVVYQNELMQLIQYEPTTETVFKRPLMIVPPWINKFYILDLRAQNSLIRWAVEQGHTVFVLSWVNPDERLARKGFADYMKEGPLDALDAIGKATGERDVNAIGYCLGGTLLGSTLAWMKTKRDTRIKSATFMAAMIDFCEAGEISVFIDEEQIGSIEEQMEERGYLEGAHMATTFNMLRANDLIWSFVVNNYLLGKEPFPFDLLYWNGDSTRMPAAMHSFYLRRMYQDNALTRPGGVELDGVPIDMNKVRTPSFILATREDHIAPWTTVYRTVNLLSGPKEFCLAASGHIAGVVNPPQAQKYSYWTAGELPPEPQQWLEKAEEHKGSWWPRWSEWIKPYTGDQVPARKPGDGELSVIEEAPGSYVKVRASG